MGKKEKQDTQNLTKLLNLLGKRTETVLSWICLRRSIICCYSLMFFQAFQLNQEKSDHAELSFHLLQKSGVSIILYLL